MLLVHQNTGKENRYGKNFFAVLINTLGRFDLANKKKSVIYTLIVIRENAITAKIKMLLWKRRHCTRGGKPPWSNPVEVKQQKRGSFNDEIQAENQVSMSWNVPLTR